MAVSRADRWFTYYYWLDDDRGARLRAHRRHPPQAGYDPVELFVDPQLPLPGLKVAWTLLKRKLGFRSPAGRDPARRRRWCKGSHGRVTDDPDDGPLFITSEAEPAARRAAVAATEVKDLVLRHVFGR